MVAGIIAGIAPDAKIMAVRIGDDEAGLDGAFRYAVDNGARVLNLSWGFPDGSAACPTLSDWQREEPHLAAGLDYALSKGAVTVAAAGNDGSDCLAYPAVDPRVISVGATSIARDQARAPFSSWGPGLDVAAPGTQIVAPTASDDASSCDLPSGYQVADGTSFSAPQVAALAALLLADNLKLGQADVAAAIRKNAVVVSGGDGVGAINVAAAFGDSAPISFQAPPAIMCTATIANHSELDFDVYLSGEYLGTVRSYGRLTLPRLAYGEQVHVQLVAQPVIGPCSASSWDLCVLTVDPFSLDACVGQPFELDIEEVAGGVQAVGLEC